MITKRKLNRKLDLLIQRQNMLAAVVFKAQLTSDGQKKMEKAWSDVYRKVMGDKE